MANDEEGSIPLKYLCSYVTRSEFERESDNKRQITCYTVARLSQKLFKAKSRMGLMNIVENKYNHTCIHKGITEPKNLLIG